MVGVPQPLADRFAIVDANGMPTPYFTRWAQKRQSDLSTAITSAQANALIAAYVAAHPLQAGSGITITPDGKLSSNPTITASVQAILDQLTTTRGSVLYRGASGWAALAPGSAGQVLQTAGAGADPSWAAAGSGSGQKYRPPIEGDPGNAVTIAGVVVYTPVHLTAGDIVTGVATSASSAITMNAGAAIYGPTNLVAYSSGIPLVASTSIASTAFAAGGLQVFSLSYTVPTTGRYWVGIYTGTAYSTFGRKNITTVPFTTGVLASFPATTGASSGSYNGGTTAFLVGSFA